MDVKREFARAKKLIDAKQYDKALEVLAHIDHPRATDWIKRVEILQASHNKQAAKKASSTVLVALLACTLSCIAVVIYASATYDETDKTRARVHTACIAASENPFSCNPDYIMEYHANAVAFCIAEIEPDTLLSDELLAVCLKMEGVDMGF